MAQQAVNFDAVLLARAQRLAVLEYTVRTNSDRRLVLSFKIGDEQYGIALSDITEVVPTGQIAKVPGAAAHFAGVTQIRGEIKSLVDLSSLLSAKSGSDGQKAYVVLLKEGDGEIGLLITSLQTVVSVQPARDYLSQNSIQGASSELIEAVTKSDLRILNCRAILARCNT